MGGVFSVIIIVVLAKKIRNFFKTIINYDTVNIIIKIFIMKFI